MKTLFKILALPLFVTLLLLVGWIFAVIGKDDSVMDFVDWYQK